MKGKKEREILGKLKPTLSTMGAAHGVDLAPEASSRTNWIQPLPASFPHGGKESLYNMPISILYT